MAETPEVIDPVAQARTRAFREMRTDSDRAVGIVGASFLEENLTECLKRHMVLSSRDHRDRWDWLTGPSAPLSAFDVKLDLGFLMGIYSKRAWRQLKLIPKIRNDFAHRVEAASFDETPILENCRQLTLIDEHLVDGCWFTLPLATPPGRTGKMTAKVQFSSDEQAPLSTLRKRYFHSCLLFMNILSNIRIHPVEPPTFDF